MPKNKIFFSAEQLVIRGKQFSSPEQIAEYFGIGLPYVRHSLIEGYQDSIGKGRGRRGYNVRGKIYDTYKDIEDDLKISPNTSCQYNKLGRLNSLGLSVNDRFKVIERYYAIIPKLKEIEERVKSTLEASPNGAVQYSDAEKKWAFECALEEVAEELEEILNADNCN